MDEVGDSGGTQRRRNLWGLSGKYLLYCSTIIACCGSGSGIQCFLGSLLDPDTGSGIRFFRMSGSGSPTMILRALVTTFWVKITFILCKLTAIYFCTYLFKNKIIFNFVKFTATKKVRQNFFPCFSFSVGSGIRGGKNQDPRSGSTSRIRNTAS
jgi:hypothetical protein